MFDLSTINFIDDTNRTNSYSFVGLKKENDSMNFYLPIGFNDFPKSSFNEVKELFLSLYKIFKKFQKNKTNDRDGSLNEKGGFEFKSEEDETIILYSKINMFDTILDEFDEMDIYSFRTKRSNSDNIDYSKLDKYIDRATFLENNVIYLDEVEINKDILNFDKGELVEMFCYIYWDIKKVLDEEEEIPPHIVSLALNFREKYLTYESSLFEEDSFEITKDTLKERLEIIDKKSLLKDAVYDKFYDAIYIFLYGNPFFDGESGTYWGINNFSFIWEEMCHYYAFHNMKKSILFADTNRFETTKIGREDCYNKEGFEYPFILKYEDKKRHLYPDLVIKIQEEKELKFDNFFLISPKNYTIPSGYNSYTNYYIELKDKYKNNKLLSDTFRVKNILSIEDNNYKLVEDGYITKQNRKYNGEYKSYLEKLKKAILMYLKYRKENTLKLKNEIELFYEIKNKIIDFKYLSKSNLEEKGIKVVNDIKKQILYKLAFQSIYDDLIVKNIFYLPYYLEETTRTEIKNLHNSEIVVKYLNFNDAKKSYLEYKNDK